MSYCYQTHAIKYCEKVIERFGKNLFQSIKTPSEVLDKLKARNSNRDQFFYVWIFYYLHHFTS